MSVPGVSKALPAGVLALGLALCSGACVDEPGGVAPFAVAAPSSNVPTAPSEIPEAFDAIEHVHCDAGDRAFVQRAFVALLGRRPLGQGEVQAHVRAIAELRKAMTERAVPDTARQQVARAMMQDDDFRVRWSDFLKDALHVARTQAKSQVQCYGDHESVTNDGGALARFVRDSDATESSAAFSGFTQRDLLASALQLDDLSVIYRANLFAMMNKPLVGNSLALELELARRNDFGAAFEATYTRRQIDCLPCHNSEYSVTADSDAAVNRFWPVPGHFERALFGNSSGRHRAQEATTKGSDVLRARGMFRYTGVVGDGVAPYGWSTDCGTFQKPTSDDPLAIDTWFGTLRSLPEDPYGGLRVSVWDLERSLRLGFNALQEEGLPRSEQVAPDTAFAALVAMNIVENVWIEVMGTSLTVGHHFARTAVQRDLLMLLTARFVRARYSLKALLGTILEQSVFNLKPPSAGCGGQPYPFDRLLDPWTETEADPALRGNGPSDGVFPLSARVLRRSLHTALQWPMYPEYPQANSAEENLAQAIGFFLRDGAPGHRGLAFQDRLSWEEAYGTCAPGSPDDFVAQLAYSASVYPEATVRDAVVALKDRLVGEPEVSDAERGPLEALLGEPLSGPASSPSLQTGLRRVCGVLVSSPMFMLWGLLPEAQYDVPKLTPEGATEAAMCRRLTAMLISVDPTATLTCASEP